MKLITFHDSEERTITWIVRSQPGSEFNMVDETMTLDLEELSPEGIKRLESYAEGFWYAAMYFVPDTAFFRIFETAMFNYLDTLFEGESK